MFTRNDLLLKTEHLIDNTLSGEPRHIAFAADQKYLRYIGIALFSILENNSDLPLHFHLFIDDMPAEEAERFRKLQTSHNQFRISLYYLNNKAFAELQTTEYFTSAIYYRFAIPAILQALHITRVLYLDTDILCIGNLTPLLDAELHGNAIGVVADAYVNALHTRHLNRLSQMGFHENNIYFNSGMMLIDTHRWDSLNINDNVAERYGSTDKTLLTYPDQDILNIVLQNHIYLLPERYNWVGWHHKDHLANLSGSPVRIIHFIGKHKPWHLLPDTVLIYSNYVSRSPWHDCVYQNPPYLQNTSEYRRYAKYLWQQNRKHEAAHYYLQYLLRKLRLIPKNQA